ncbi:uncharacterized protein LOC110461177 [Mizuhopecten yessoensis]|uniref:uncharacterized protein LOC110461177 n=1 Tax=Mizuhopecten yessoensis TaxID=6573 RepID=UPI000B45F8E2|nr:uncharacterized protein LOC110461177 [Mizuhopecten yessoensis]
MGKSDLNKSVGIIKIKINDQLESGTGFRFGENYVMTAYHVFEGIVKHVWKLVMAIVEQSDKKEAIYQKISTMFSRSSADIDPKRQALPFGHLFEYLHTMGLPIEVFEEKWKDAVNIEFGVREGKTTAGEFNFEYNIPFADSDHDVVVLQISKGSKGLPPPLTLAKYMVADKVHLFGYPIGSTEIDLSSDIKCRIYADNRELTGDVTKAIEWWRKEKRRPVKNEYAVCHYINDNHTDTGKIFLHTSKQFERGSSGCPAITFINEQPVVQLMYLRGYPEFCYKEGTFPPPQYLFEAGVSMPVVTRLLQECCRQIMA